MGFRDVPGMFRKFNGHNMGVLRGVKGFQGRYMRFQRVKEGFKSVSGNFRSVEGVSDAFQGRYMGVPGEIMGVSGVSGFVEIQGV